MPQHSEEIERLRDAVEEAFRCRAEFGPSTYVCESVEGTLGWNGVVYAFDIAGNPDAVRAYGWSAWSEDSHGLRPVVLLHGGAVRSPSDAVRAVLARAAPVTAPHRA